LPGYSSRIFFVRPFLADGLRRFGAASVGMFSAPTVVSSKSTVAFPPIASPSRIEGVRFIGARLGAQEERQVVSKDGFWMFFVLGDRGPKLVFTARGIRTLEVIGAGMLG